MSDFVEKYKVWKSKKDDSGFKFVRLDDDKLVFEEELGGKRIFIKYPETKEDIFFPEGPGWCEDLMQFCINNNPPFEKILDKMSDLIKKAQSKGNNKKLNLKKKKESSETSTEETNDSSDDNLSGSGLGMSSSIKFALSEKEEEDLRDQVSEAKDMLGSAIQIEEDIAGVSIKIKISDVLKEDIATSIGINIQEDLHVLLTYERKNQINVKASQLGRNENYGIKFFSREVIEDFIRDFKGERMSGCSINFDQILEEINPPKEVDNKQILSTATKTNVVEVTHDKVKLVVAMGFDYGTAVYALQETNNTPEFAINAIMSDINKKFKPSSSIEKHVQEMVKQGYSHLDAYVRLKETNDDMKKAIKLLKEIKISNNSIDLKNLSTDSVEYKLNWAKKKGKEITKNLYISLYYWFRGRLRNYSQRCVICSAIHKCNPFGTKPVVCSKTLCVFSWENRKLGELHDTKLCPFMNCEHSVFDPEKFKHLNEALCSQNNSFGVELNFLVEMAQHKYLPYESLLDFISVGAKQNNMVVKKITNVLNPPLCARFERRFKELVESRGKEEVKFQMCYHGTSKTNIDSICRNGLLVPGKNYVIDGKPLCIGHATDTGWYGKGIYTSPNAGVSLGYCRQGGMLLICSIIMAKMFKCTNCIHGAPLMSGYDSHSDPYGNEWIVFDECQVLPCYLVEF